MRKITILILTIWFNVLPLMFGLHAAHAVTEPSFPSCVNPQGTIKENYASGTHGVPGDTTTYTGTDKVYYVTTDTVMQCLCPENGLGIQTNWWKVPQISESEINQFEGQGWIYVPNGGNWGLENVSYLAKNIRYACRESVLGTSAQGSSKILGLASTGNWETILASTLIGLWLLVVGLSIRQYVNKAK